MPEHGRLLQLCDNLLDDFRSASRLGTMKEGDGDKPHRLPK